MKIRIALDIAVGFRRKKDLIALGYDVVCVAKDSETDESWMNRAFSEGAMFAVSPDMDIPKLIETSRYPMVWINYPNDNLTLKHDMVGYVDRAIKFKMDTYRSFVAEPVKESKKGFFASLLLKLKGA